MHTESLFTRAPCTLDDLEDLICADLDLIAAGGAPVPAPYTGPLFRGEPCTFSDLEDLICAALDLIAAGGAQ